MPLKLPKINGNSLYSPSVMIFLLIVGYQIANSDFVEKTYSFAYLLVTAGVLLFLKTFTFTFGALEKTLNTKKVFLASSFLILAIGQFLLGFLAVDHLTRSTFPDITVQWFLFANILFAIQTFLAKSTNLFKVALFTIFASTVSFFGLYFKWFTSDIQAFIIFQQSIGYLAIILEFTMFFMSLNFFIDKSK